MYFKDITLHTELCKIVPS